MSHERAGLHRDFQIVKGLFGISKAGIFSADLKDVSGELNVGLEEERLRLQKEIGSFDLDSIPTRSLPVFNRIVSVLEKAQGLDDARRDFTIPKDIGPMGEEQSEEERIRAFYRDVGFLALASGALWDLYRSASEAISLAKNEDPLLRRYLELGRFRATSMIQLQIGGLSIVDIARSNGGIIPPDKFFRALMEAALISNGKKPDEDVNANLARENFRDYPILTTCTTYVTSALINGLYFADSEIIDIYEDPKVRRLSKFKKTAKLLTGIFQDNSHNIQTTLLDPSSPKFKPLKERIEKYLSGGEVESTITLYLLFNGSQDYLKQLYRVAVEQTPGDDGDFYAKLLKPLIRYIEDSTDFMTARDQELFFDGLNGDIAPNLKDLEAKSLSIGNLSREREFEIDPESLIVKGLVIPNSTRLNIDPYSPRKFTLDFEYMSENGETETVVLSVDTKRYAEGVEWSFIDLPSSLPSARAILLMAADLILTKVERELKEKKLMESARKKEIKKQDTPKTPKTEKIRPAKETVSSSKRRTLVVKPIIPPVYEAIANAEVRREIVISDPRNFRRMIGKLDPEDQKSIQAEIDDFNARGVGRFKRMIEDFQGYDAYSLRVKSKAPSGIRVIVIEVSPNGKTRRFEIVQIGYRRDIYRKYSNRA